MLVCLLKKKKKRGGCWDFNLKLNQLKNKGGVEMLFDLQ